eukprot:TRINITY_DN6443_c0_g1_i2.p1 TRINITY_DN6443_c0_g1~~TRINITY_DN6443_c0_g1_i2.p1  ORF type:complete len:323 (-),score=57.23 TRINITY_DN6443_c0_g1_i2:198-1166(-)
MDTKDGDIAADEHSPETIVLSPSLTAVTGGASHKRTKKKSRLTADAIESPRTVRRFPSAPTDASLPLPTAVRLGVKADEIVVASDGLTASNQKGYCTARANYLMTSGSWYYEIQMGEYPPPGCARLGWATNYCDLEANVGFDFFGYGYRSSPPGKIHDASVQPYGSPFGPGDVVGFYIHLPDVDYEPPNLSEDPSFLVGFNVRQKTPNPIVPGSFIEFFVNGVSQGIAFRDLFYGRYTAAISLYRGAKITCNFGPSFKYPPKDLAYQPLSHLAELAHEKAQAALQDSTNHKDELETKDEPGDNFTQKDESQFVSIVSPEPGA